MEFSADAQTPGNAVAAAPRYSPYVPHAGAFRDAAGNYLDGALSYKLTLPAPIPAKDLWALTVYDNLTRSLLPTDQKTGGSRQPFRESIRTRAAVSRSGLDLNRGQ